MARLVGAVGGAAASWVMVTLRPATLMVALREAVVVFALTAKVHDPEPVCEPVPPVIHVGRPLADHEHVLDVETERLPLIPPAGAVTLVGVTV
jgi:hypothetical protein